MRHSSLNPPLERILGYRSGSRILYPCARPQSAPETPVPAISRDLRVRVFEARQAGDTTAEVADRFAVSPAFVRRLLQRYRETGSLDPRSGRPGPRPRLAGDHDHLRASNAEHPDPTPAEAAAALRLRTSPVTVWRAFKALGLTVKKNAPRLRTRPPGREGRPPVALASRFVAKALRMAEAEPNFAGP